MTPLSIAILRTLAYFDVFDYPLTIDQLWRWLYPADGQTISASLSDVEQELEKPELKSKVGRGGTYVFLAGRDHIVAVRESRFKYGERKWKRVLSAIGFLEVVPFIRMVAVVNTLAIDNAKEESDMDLLIVTAPQHLWLARLAITGIVSMLGYRRHGDKIKNRICLSFYSTTDVIDFSPLQLQPKDPHFAFWTSQAVPLINNNGTYEKFQSANAWVKDYLPNAWDWNWQSRVVKPNSGLQSIRLFFETAFTQPIGSVLETMARDQQMKKMEKNTTSKASLGTSEVVISDHMLKFHEDDRRARYNQAFVERLQKLGLA